MNIMERRLPGALFPAIVRRRAAGSRLSTDVLNMLVPMSSRRLILLLTLLFLATSSLAQYGGPERAVAQPTLTARAPLEPQPARPLAASDGERFLFGSGWVAPRMFVSDAEGLLIDRFGVPVRELNAVAGSRAGYLGLYRTALGELRALPISRDGVSGTFVSISRSPKIASDFAVRSNGCELRRLLARGNGSLRCNRRP